MSFEKKLKLYIKADRPQKLKEYVMSNDIDISEAVLSRGWSILHYCAQHGSSDMLRCLLKLDCVPDQQDKQGNLPLHLAAHRALNEVTAEARQELLNTMLIPLLQAYPLGRDVENREGDTGYDLVTAVKNKVKAESKGDEELQRQKERIACDEEEMWQRKLREEMKFEFEEQQPRYNAEEDRRAEEEAETEEEWRERIRKEMDHKQDDFFRCYTTNKRRDKKHKHKKQTRWEKLEQEQKQKEKERAAEQDRLRKAREEMRMRFKPTPAPMPEKQTDKKQRYESKYAHLLKNLSGRNLTFGCIPWPHTNLDHVASTLFCDLPDRSSGEYKKYLRSQQIRWHPDKFTQKFGEHLHPDHAKKIMTRVKNISQLLNELASAV